jgi:outer membrane protein OmpA-like peptidoglycan-associated protein
MDPQTVVDALASAQAIPDLTGVDVLWLGCGTSTVSPQESLSEAQKANLRQIWSQTLTAGGATSVTFDDGENTGVANEGLPAVSTVSVEDRSLDLVSTTILSDTQISFQGDSAAFTDPTAAQSAVTAVAQELLNKPSQSVYVVGMTAGGRDEAFSKSLSQDRAQAVKDLLVACGVDESRLTALGLGASGPWYTYDLDENGKQISKISQTNRAVVIVDTQSADAAALADA